MTGLLRALGLRLGLLANDEANERYSAVDLELRIAEGRDAAPLPVVYVVCYAEWPNGDVEGALIIPGEGPVWAHLSSNRRHLRLDLTTQFQARRAALDLRFPDGYRVGLVDDGDPIPEDIAEFVSAGGPA